MTIDIPSIDAAQAFVALYATAKAAIEIGAVGSKMVRAIAAAIEGSIAKIPASPSKSA